MLITYHQDTKNLLIRVEKDEKLDKFLNQDRMKDHLKIIFEKEEDYEKKLENYLDILQ